MVVKISLGSSFRTLLELFDLVFVILYAFKVYDPFLNTRYTYIFSMLISYGKDIEKILATLEENTDPECVALMMEFLLLLVKLKLTAITPLYPACIKSAMTWVPVEQVGNLYYFLLLSPLAYVTPLSYGAR